MKQKKTSNRHSLKKVLRTTYISLVALAFFWPAGHAWSGSRPTQESKASLERWSNWWMDETCRQAVPTPQLLYVIGQPSDADVKRLGLMDGCLHLTGSITTLYQSGFGSKHEWHQANAGLISAEAFVLPSAVQQVHEWEFGAFMVVYNYDGTLPTMYLKPSQETEPSFHWFKDISIPESIRSTVFNGSGYGKDTPLKIKFPKLLSPGYQAFSCYNPFSDPREWCG
jgi:hypothetical protein